MVVIDLLVQAKILFFNKIFYPLWRGNYYKQCAQGMIVSQHSFLETFPLNLGWTSALICGYFFRQLFQVSYDKNFPDLAKYFEFSSIFIMKTGKNLG